jgi:hypothetical protein
MTSPGEIHCVNKKCADYGKVHPMSQEYFDGFFAKTYRDNKAKYLCPVCQQPRAVSDYAFQKVFDKVFSAHS